MQGKVLDLTVLLNMVAAMSVCLAFAFWFFAVARYLQHSGKRDRDTALSLVGFAMQLPLIALSAFIESRRAGSIAMVLSYGTAAVLSVVNVIWALRSSSVAGERMRVATLLWIAGIILAFTVPQQ